MNKAYIIVAHKAPNQLFRLISRLNDGQSEFFVHIDAKADIDTFKNLKELGNIVTFTERFDAKWGGLGVIKPYLSALKFTRDSGKHFDRYMLLSGQDYPIKNNQEIDKFFENESHTNFIDYFPIPNLTKWPRQNRGGLYRVDKYYFGNKWYEFFQSKTLNLLASYLPVLRRKIPFGMKPYTGQTWWNIDTQMRDYILDFHQSHPEYIHFHRNTFVADELFIQMIIGNCTDQNLINSISNRELRFTVWEHPNSAHPKIFGVNDFELIKASEDLFARKFDEKVDSEIMNMIDDELLNDKYSSLSA